MPKELSPEETKRVEEIVSLNLLHFNLLKDDAVPMSIRDMLKSTIEMVLQPHLEENARLREALKEHKAKSIKAFGNLPIWL